MKILTPYFLYSKGYFLFVGLMSLLTFLIFLQVGLGSLTLMFWFKVITSALAVIFYNNLKAKELFFYLNIGIGKKELSSFLLLMDFISWFIGIFILIKLCGT